MDLTSYSDSLSDLNEQIDGYERNDMYGEVIEYEDNMQSRMEMCEILGNMDNYLTTQTTYNQMREPIGISIDGVRTGDDDNMQLSMQTSRMANDFNVLDVLGRGGYGTVFKCQCKADNNLYAIKKVPFESKKRETVYKELNFLSQLDSKFVVKYIDSWDEENFAIIDKYDDEYLQNINSSNRLFDPNLRFLLHIQMELCALTLRDVIKIIIKECLTGEDKTLSLIGYYICSEMFIEILECVQYLHEQTPPIIHRDLKPENFLINFVNNRFVKLSDFGLSTFHEYADQSHTAGNMGTTRYIAPEILAQSAHTSNGKMKAKYTTQADCFSLGIILQELFNSVAQRRYLPVLNVKMNKIETLSEELHSLSPTKRPNCDVMLTGFELLRLTDDEIKSDESFTQIITNTTNSYSIDNQFIEFFVHNKYKFSVRPLINAVENQNISGELDSATSSHLEILNRQHRQQTFAYAQNLRRQLSLLNKKLKSRPQTNRDNNENKRPYINRVQCAYCELIFDDTGDCQRHMTEAHMIDGLARNFGHKSDNSPVEITISDSDDSDN